MGETLEQMCNMCGKWVDDKQMKDTDLEMLCDACPDWEDKLGYCAKWRLKRTDAPTIAPTSQPTGQPLRPTSRLSGRPTSRPTSRPTVATDQPTERTTNLPTSLPTNPTDDLRTSPPIDALEACDNDTSKLSTAEEAC